MDKQPGIGQKISFTLALLFYLAAIACLVATFYYAGQLGSESPVVAAFSASIVFFVGAGIVFHVIGKANLPDLRIK